MKKIVRTVWISALSGLAFLVACCTQQGLTKAERKHLLQEREQIGMELAGYQGRFQEPEYRDADFDEYMAVRDKVYTLENKLDTINFRLGDSIDLDHNFRRRQLLQRIDSLNFLIDHYVPSCIYGSPEMMKNRRYRRTELDDYQDALEAVQKELNDLDRTETDGSEIIELLYGGPDIQIIPEKPVLIQKDSIQNENLEK